MVVRSILGIGPVSGRQYYKVTVSQSHWLSPISPYPEWSLAVALHWEWNAIDLLHKSHNAPVSHPMMHHFVREMCTYVHISVTKWCIVVYFSDALWDLWDWSIALSLNRGGWVNLWRTSKNNAFCGPSVTWIPLHIYQVHFISHIWASKLWFRPVFLRWPLAQMASKLKSFWHRLK